MQLKRQPIPLPRISTAAKIMVMSVVSIYLVIAALVLVASLIICGFLYLSLGAIASNLEDEENFVLIDTDDPGIFSIYKQVLYENGWMHNLATRKASILTPVTPDNCSENSADEEGRYFNQHQGDDYLRKKSSPIPTNDTRIDNFGLFSDNEDIEQRSNLEETSLDSSAML